MARKNIQFERQSFNELQSNNYKLIKTKHLHYWEFAHEQNLSISIHHWRVHKWHVLRTSSHNERMVQLCC